MIGVCLPSDQQVGPGDEFLIRQIADLPHPPKLVALATKIDLVKPARLAEHLASIGALEEQLGIRWESVIPVSAVSGEQVEIVVDEIIKLLPPGPAWYPDGETTDEPIEVRVGELIRESLLESVVEEVPHSIAIEIDEIRDKRAPTPTTGDGGVRVHRAGAQLPEGHHHRPPRCEAGRVRRNPSARSRSCSEPTST